MSSSTWTVEPGGSTSKVEPGGSTWSVEPTGSIWKEECGVFGVWNYPEAARMTYLGLYAMQHRGQESAGIVSCDNSNGKNPEHIHHKGLGLVGEVFNEAALNRLKGTAAVGHVRYSTTGDNLLTNAQPLTANLFSGPIAVAHNGNIVNTDQLKKDLKLAGSIFQGTNDTEVLLHLIARHPSDQILNCLMDSLPKLIGAFSFVILTKDKLVASRDPGGFRPLVMGKKDNGSILFASETCAFDLVGAEYVREVEPGEIIVVDDTGVKSHFYAKQEKKSHCVFEHVYFSRPDSVVFSKSVYESRKDFGRMTAKENPVAADIVIPVPDSGIAAALGYSLESGIPLEFGIIRNHYVGRTFIQPEPSIRDFGVKIKLNPQSAVLKGKRVVVVDDSLVRGTTSKKIVQLIRQAGATEVHMRIAAPPTMSPCYYGVDTPQQKQLIASHNSIEQICDFIEADTLGYLSLDGMFKAMHFADAIQGKQKFCAACFDGDYPTVL
jgi:amidophosphoribosyltransferase